MYVRLMAYLFVICSVGDSQEVASLRGHEASVTSISLHSSGRLALAVSSRDCVIWDLESFTRHKTLNGGQEVGVQDVRVMLDCGRACCV